MTQPQIDRRNLLAAGGVIAAAAALPAAAAAQPVAAGPAPYAPQPVALGFDPEKVPGLSARLLTSHHDNNYVGAVKRLGAIHGQLAGIDPASAPGFQLEGLKRAELIAWNSMILHEVYFAQFGTPRGPGGALAAAIERDFGSMARWQAEFAGLGKALGGGSGWVVLSHGHRDNRLVNQWAADHTMALAGGTPILVLDMYEHAYAMDYGAKAAAYVDAALAAFDWSAAERRYAKSAA